MKNFVFKETIVKSMKIAGIVDVDTMHIDIDGEDKNLRTLLSPFNGAVVEINVKVKDEQELDEPDEEVDIDDLTSQDE